MAARSRPNKTARNERRKLLATWLNTLAGATVTVGVLAPIAGLYYGISASPRTGIEIATAIGIWLVAGGILHLLARSRLGGIEE